MGERIRRMTARELERLLKTDGFELVSQRAAIANGAIRLKEFK